jgi:hypothetical protein
MLEMFDMTDDLRLRADILPVDTMRRSCWERLLLIGSCFSISSEAETSVTTISVLFNNGACVSYSVSCNEETGMLDSSTIFQTYTTFYSSNHKAESKIMSLPC